LKEGTIKRDGAHRNVQLLYLKNNAVSRKVETGSAALSTIAVETCISIKLMLNVRNPAAKHTPSPTSKFLTLCDGNLKDGTTPTT
jgi:hypothetical protein